MRKTAIVVIANLVLLMTAISFADPLVVSSYHIQGTITYGAPQTQSGTIYVGAYFSLGAEFPVEVAIATGTGPYSYDIEIESGSYLIMAYMDVNGNQYLDVGEPMGFYTTGTEPTSVTVGLDQPGINIIIADFTDYDGDGIHDDWELMHFGDLSTADDHNTDFDQDGYTDKQEYLNRAETDPDNNPYDPTVQNAPGGTGYDGATDSRVGMVTGRITDSSTSEGISDVRVESNIGDVYTYTYSDGYYGLWLVSGTHTLTATKVGFASESWTVIVSGDNSLPDHTMTSDDTTPPTATITYSTSDPTNQDVVAMLNPSETVTVTNNGGLTARIFTENGSFTFEFEDAAGNTGTAVAMVTWIDKTAPTATINYSTTMLTNQDVVAILMWFNFNGHHAKSNYSESEVFNERKTKTSKLHERVQTRRHKIGH